MVKPEERPPPALLLTTKLTVTEENMRYPTIVKGKGPSKSTSEIGLSADLHGRCSTPAFYEPSTSTRTALHILFYLTL
jgi:hypothetical protein